jgi:hypothetical protein
LENIKEVEEVYGGNHTTYVIVNPPPNLLTTIVGG